MTNRILILLASLALIGCSHDDGKNRNNEGFSCPLVVYRPSHEVNIYTDLDIPEKIAVKLDGELKYDECQDPPNSTDAPPIVGLRKTPGRLRIVVIHNGAYQELPETMTLEVTDRKNCSTETMFFEIFDEPIDFKQDYPHGEQCQSRTFAELDFEL